MSTVVDSPPAHTSDSAFAALSPDHSRLAEAPAWFQQRAASAWQEFLKLPLPGRTDESWRYSHAGKLNLDTLRRATPGTPEQKAAAIAQSRSFDKAAARFIFLNDELIDSQTSGIPDGLICVPFAEALRSHGDVLEQYFMKRESALGSAKFAALHLAHVAAGVVVLAPKGLVLEQPIEVFHWATGEHATVFPHTLIVTGDLAQVTVIDHHGSLNQETTQSIAVADLVAGTGSKITFINAQELDRQARALHISSTTVGKDASVTALQLQLGSSFARTESVSDLVGEGARSEMLGVSLPFGDQIVDMRTLQNHMAPHTYSDLLYKNALYDQSRTVFSGLIVVAEGAHFTDAYQKCRNLLNSSDAEAVSMPGLEINADQVKCSHGATSAPIDNEELFYLKARGIPDAESRHLIATGFLEDVISRLGEGELGTFLDERIERKMAL